MVDIIEQEAAEDVYRLALLIEEPVIVSPQPRAVRTRLPRLVVNPGTALNSSTVVVQFTGTIAAVAILAALMPVVAAQGGTAGNQSMTIIVRSLGLGQIDLKDFWPVFRHEFGAGILYGLVLGSLVAAIFFIWIGNRS